jgi:hypothetical protein
MLRGVRSIRLAPGLSGHVMPGVDTAIRTVSVLAVLTGIAGSAPAAQAQGAQPLPDCDPAVPPAVVFAGLPDRIPYGRTEEYGFIRNPASDRKVPHPVVLDVIDEGQSIYKDTTRSRGDDLYVLTLYVFGSPVRVNLQFTEVAPDGSSCHRILAKRVSGMRDGKRFEAWVERAGSRRPAHAFPPGAGLSFVFTDRFSWGTPYRLCWHRPNGSKRKCRPHRTGQQARRPDSLFATAPKQRGPWIATWRTGGLIVATWRFRVTT